MAPVNSKPSHEETQVVILRNLPAELARALASLAEERGISPDELAQSIIVDHVRSHDGLLPKRDR